MAAARSPRMERPKYCLLLIGTSIWGAANAGKLMLVAVVSTAGVLALWLLPIILGCGALDIGYCLLATTV